MSENSTSECNIEVVRPYEKIPWASISACESATYKFHYVVFLDGRIWSQRKKRFLKPRPNTNGYLRVWINGKDEYIHRIVATVFVKNPNGYLEVNHIDGNKSNNHAQNLEWCTRSYNNKHAFATGLRSYSELQAMATCENAMRAKRRQRLFSVDTVLRIRRMIHEGKSDRLIAMAVGGSCGSINQIRTGKTYKEIADGNTD